MDEEKPTVVMQGAVPELACGHKDTFEHRFVDGFVAIINARDILGEPLIDTLIRYTQDVFNIFYLQIPDYNQMTQILSVHHQQQQQTKKEEVQ